MNVDKTALSTGFGSKISFGGLRMFFNRGATFETEYVSIQLPRGWKRVGSDNPTLAIFEHASEDKRLSVSDLGINAPCDSAADLRQAVEDVYHVRVQAERSLIAADDPIVANGVDDAAGRSLGFFCGYQRASGRLFGGYVYGAGRVIITLYLEGFSTDQRQHMDCLIAILNRVEFKNFA